MIIPHSNNYGLTLSACVKSHKYTSVAHLDQVTDAFLAVLEHDNLLLLLTFSNITFKRHRSRSLFNTL